MKNVTTILIFTLIVLNTYFVKATEIEPDEVKNVMERVADWQIEHFDEPYSREKPHHQLDWTNAALYVGMVKWADMTNDDSYYKWLRKIGDNNEWTLHKRRYHGDDHAVLIQVFLIRGRLSRLL